MSKPYKNITLTLHVTGDDALDDQLINAIKLKFQGIQIVPSLLPTQVDGPDNISYDILFFIEDLLANPPRPRLVGGPKIRCLHCFDVVQSMDRHDMVHCTCKNIFVDGGVDYLRIGGKRIEIDIDYEFVHPK